MGQDERERLFGQARRCRKLATSIGDEPAQAALRRLAEEYEARAERLAQPSRQ